MNKKIGYHQFTGLIRLKSGMRIGGSDDILQIGGADATSIRNPATLDPYIPGTSIKGKMRSELEQSAGRYSPQGKPCDCIEPDCLVCIVFGPHAQTKHGLGPARIIVRDAPLKEGGKTEIKSSTAINRTTGAALSGSLRSEERVLPGSVFELRIGIHEWDRDDKLTYTNLKKAVTKGNAALIAFIADGLILIERTGLGSGVSKGSGEIEFADLKLNGQPFTLE